MAFELGTDGPRVIVVGYDASEPADHALAYAIGLARRNAAQLVVAYATPTYVLAPLGAGVDASLASVATSMEDEVRRRAETHLDDAGVAWRYVTGIGDAVRMLERVARETRADAIVVGRSHQREHRLIGSVSIRLVRGAQWPITVVP